MTEYECETQYYTVIIDDYEYKLLENFIKAWKERMIFKLLRAIDNIIEETLTGARYYVDILYYAAAHDLNLEAICKPRGTAREDAEDWEIYYIGGRYEKSDKDDPDYKLIELLEKEAETGEPILNTP